MLHNDVNRSLKVKKARKRLNPNSVVLTSDEMNKEIQEIEEKRKMAEKCKQDKQVIRDTKKLEMEKRGKALKKTKVNDKGVTKETVHNKKSKDKNNNHIYEELGEQSSEEASEVN
ncbi:unnamed protein product [Rotaria magnacalcarata]|uniref:Uncharacterized protein n=1 Tax=Rotaria magnacalcarata TaxID=392030 RepID=A0A820LMA0_9BILA|nr:unnamed protein product [Rotaria magnacalcarata]CAF4359117.1 unnamed protein product [Rotaria magnacalcarata]